MIFTIIALGLFASKAMASCNAVEIPAGLPPADKAPIVNYDGEAYKLSPAELAALESAIVNGTYFEKPDGMPVIDLQPGTMLDLGVGDTSDASTGLDKRSGNRIINIYGGYNCPSFSFIAGVQNFGCGTGCINLGSYGLSAWVAEQYHSNPYPTGLLYEGIGCTGRQQSVGISGGTNSCTNSNYCSIQSFIGYYNC